MDMRINPWRWAPRPAGSDPDGQAGTRRSITGSLGPGTESGDGNLPALGIVRGALAGQARQSALPGPEGQRTSAALRTGRHRIGDSRLPRLNRRCPNRREPVVPATLMATYHEEGRASVVS